MGKSHAHHLDRRGQLDSWDHPHMHRNCMLFLLQKHHLNNTPFHHPISPRYHHFFLPQFLKRRISIHQLWTFLRHPSFRSGLLLADCKWLHLIVITFNTLCLVKFYIQWCRALKWTRWRSYLSIWFVPALQANFPEKLLKLVALQISHSTYLSCGESLNHNTLSNYY